MCCSILRLGRSRTLKYETATPAEDEDIFGTNLVMKSLKNLQKFNEEFPLSGLTRVMTLPTKRGENKGAGPRRMSGLLRQSKRHSKPDLHDREGTAPTTEKEPPSVTSEGEVPTERHKEVGEVPTAMCEEVCGGGGAGFCDNVTNYVLESLGHSSQLGSVCLDCSIQ